MRERILGFVSKADFRRRPVSLRSVFFESRRDSTTVLRQSLACLLLVISSGGWITADELSFNRDIRPILSDACFSCHGPDSAHREADLRLDVEQSAKADAIVPGQSDASEMIARITTDDADALMPPADSGKQLTKDEIELLSRWVDQGTPTKLIGLT